MSASTHQRRRSRVAILGAGFAGINAAHGLRRADVDVTIIDRNNFHTFQPLLYQVATAYLAPEEVGVAVRSVFRTQTNVNFRMGEVTAADWDSGTLTLDSGGEVNFDYLVVAAGAVANYFGIEGMEENSWPLYTLDDAVALRKHLLAQLENSARLGTEQVQPSTVVVVGGGPTGVETAGALSSMAHDLLGKDASRLHVILVEAIPRLLGAFTHGSSWRALDDLRRRGVEVRLDAAVASADATGVTFTDGKRIDTPTLVWAAGVSAGNIGEVLSLPTGKGGAIRVRHDLRVHGHDNVFAIGDVATVDPAPKWGQPPLLAPNAIQGGKHAARQITRLVGDRKTAPYVYRDKGAMAVLGRGDAVAELPAPLPAALRRRIKGADKALRFGGAFAWLLWLGVHVVYLIGFRNRLKVLVDWGWNYLTSRGSSAILLRGNNR